MPTYADLESSAPVVAAFLRQRIDETGLCFLATTRSDGWPRASGIELWVHDGRIYVGSMPNAVKAKDLLRDPRCCIITTLTDKDDLRGDVKVFCRARAVDDPDEWEGARAAFEAVRGFDMGGPGGAHLFELGVEGAAWTRVIEDDALHTSSWTVDGGPRERRRTGALGESVDVT